MNAIIQAIVPIFFVLFLGYIAGKRNAFDQEQAQGFNRLVLEFALPALLFSSIAQSTREKLFSDTVVFFVATAALVGWYFVTFFVAKFFFRHDRRESAVAGLSAAAPTVGFLGIAVLTPLYGQSAAITVAVVSLVVNAIQVPLAMVLLSPPGAKPIDALTHAIKQPIVFAPVAAVVLVVAGVPLPSAAVNMLALIGGTTSGVAVFAAGLTLSAHQMQFNIEIAWNSVGKLLILPGVTMALALWCGITGERLQEVVLLAGLPPAFSGIILASRFKTYVEESASTLIVSSILFALSAPMWIMLAKHFSGGG